MGNEYNFYNGIAARNFQHLRWNPIISTEKFECVKFVFFQRQYFESDIEMEIVQKYYSPDENHFCNFCSQCKNSECQEFIFGSKVTLRDIDGDEYWCSNCDINIFIVKNVVDG